MFRCNNDNLIRGLLLRSNEAGVSPDTMCGVFLYVNRKVTSLRDVDNLSPECNTCFVKPRFKICTDHSAAPFDAGWYRGVSVCFNPLFFKNDLKMDEVNCGLLSDTTSSGNSNEANKVRKMSQVLSAEVFLVSNTSSYFEISLNSRLNF